MGETMGGVAIWLFIMWFWLRGYDYMVRTVSALERIADALEKDKE